MSAGTAAAAAAPAAAPAAASGSSGDLKKDNSTEHNIRESNIVAGRAIADTLRTSLGPRGMDKMITAADGRVTITNDGATILEQLQLQHPAAKIVCRTHHQQRKKDKAKQKSQPHKHKHKHKHKHAVHDQTDGGAGQVAGHRGR